VTGPVGAPGKGGGRGSQYMILRGRKVKGNKENGGGGMQNGYNDASSGAGRKMENRSMTWSPHKITFRSVRSLSTVVFSICCKPVPGPSIAETRDPWLNSTILTIESWVLQKL